MGTGGAPEGVISAAAIRCIGGNMQGRLKFRNEEEKTRATKMGVKDLHKIFSLEEMARGNVMFCATGVTQGNFLNGVKFMGSRVSTHSVVMRSESGTVRHIHAEHQLTTKPKY